MSDEPVHIVGFTPVGVMLAERLTATQADKSNVILLEQGSSSIVDDHWQSVSLLCFINLLKRCRMLLSAESRKFGVHLNSIVMNEQLVYSSIQSATQCVQKYYLNLLRQREVRFELLDGQSNDQHSSWQSYFGRCLTENPLEQSTTYMTYNHTADPDFDRSPRVNIFRSIFHDFREHSFLKLIGPDIFTFELAHLLACSCSPSEIYLYRMNPSEASMLTSRETNARLVTLFEIFSNRRQQAVVQRAAGEHQQPSIHILREFQHFKIDSDADGTLTYERVPISATPIESTVKETKRNKRTYLKSFREESLTKLSSSNIRIGGKHSFHLPFCISLFL